MLSTRRAFAFLLLWMAILVPGIALAETPADIAFRQRAMQLPDVLRGTMAADAYFAPSFLAQVPVSQVRLISDQLAKQNGSVGRVERSQLVSGTSGIVDVGYELAVIRFNVTVEPQSPNKVIGLLVASIRARNDSGSKLETEFRGLPGKAAVLVRRLDDPREAPRLAVNATESMAQGSGFKLWILAEAARAVSARERRWDSVIPIGRPSLPSGVMQGWPRRAPATLHTLATMMISQSDNTATDTLLMALGRERVGAMVGVTGHRNPSQTLPVLSTLEAFALKADRNAAVRAPWISGSVDDRARALARVSPGMTADRIDLVQLAGTPKSIDTVEWFASPTDMAATLDWFRRKGDPEALAILAVNPGLVPGDAGRFAYVGYKGGSEIGVMAMNLLIKTKDGRWYSVTGAWNNPQAGVDQGRFSGLMTRAAALIEQPAPQLAP
jgi:hypothetical protein